MALLSKDQIWQAHDITYEDVPVPEWGGEVRIRGLAGEERDAFEEASLKRGRGGSRELNLKNARARLIAACAINEDGSPMFVTADVLKLGSKSAAALERLFKVAQRLSGMTAEDMDELTGNSEPGQSGPSPSASPGTSDTPSPSFSLGSHHAS
ncbi:hypothetical protein DP939_02620 [Spongiactinospora rosea]|uniref:Tail assembly chaperone n=1 Tax=Spongiactinospora rosea TaxID=2248750 RepID=A0A366M719_9ACTN|nr:hypothetical protein [Spongiactinospora rosea]RBQ21623.1 hypothetical protein DP939_02620 [Spongiactinospora rosea]